MGAAPRITGADAPQGLTERDRQIIDFERQWWKYAGAKEQAITKQFSMSPTNYYQLLNQLIETDAALAYDPMLVKRLRRARSTKRRVGGKVGTGR